MKCAAEFVDMTMAFADQMARFAASQNHSEYVNARAEITQHLEESYRAITLAGFAKGMAYQKEREKGKEE